MRLIALRQRYVGNGVRIEPGDSFEVEKYTEAMDMLTRGLARLPQEPVIRYQTKVVTPIAPEVKAEAKPFRDGDVPDEKPARLATEGDQELPETDVQAPRIIDRGERSRRKRRGSRK